MAFRRLMRAVGAGAVPGPHLPATPVAAPPPAPERRPQHLASHGDVRVDDWFWLRDVHDPAVQAYIEAENRYSDEVSRPWKVMRDRWEMGWRDSARPARESFTPAWSGGGYRYQWHHRRLFRQPVDGRGNGAERPEPIVDLSVYGANSLGFRLGTIAVSPDHRLVALTFERTGAERFTLRLRDIVARRDLTEVIEGIGPSVAWLNPSTLLYTRLDRRGIPTQVWRRTLGAAPDTQIYQESEGDLFVTVGRTTSGAFAKIVSSTHTESEVRLVVAADDGPPPRLVAPRQPGVTYDVEHHPGGDGRLFLLVRDPTRGHRVLTQPVGGSERRWDLFYALPEGQEAHSFDVGPDHLVVVEQGRQLRLSTISLVDGAAAAAPRPLPLPDQASISVGLNGDYGRLRAVVATSGPLDPGTLAELDPVTGDTVVLYRHPAPKGFIPGNYVVTELRAAAADGTAVPLTVFRQRDTPLDGRAPALLRGYGAYGISNRPAFSPSDLTLADRGWVLAFAHVRGGGERGSAWHRAGRRTNKLNSITDFIACAEALVEAGATSADRLAVRGGSAGGLLVCAAVNRRPDLFAAAVAEVPFVDCLTSLLEPDHRLTQSGWDEFGNPLDDPEVYRSIAAWSPYDNVPPGPPYPAILLTGGLQDPRVPFWEPLKFAAKLRAGETVGGRPLLMRTAMQSGHGGNFTHHQSDESFVLAFLVTQVESCCRAASGPGRPDLRQADRGADADSESGGRPPV